MTTAQKIIASQGWHRRAGQVQRGLRGGGGQLSEGLRKGSREFLPLNHSSEVSHSVPWTDVQTGLVFCHFALLSNEDAEKGRAERLRVQQRTDESGGPVGSGRRGVNPAPRPRRGGHRGIARARPPGLNLPPPAAGARPPEARVQRGRGCGSGPAASRGSRAAAAGTGAVRDRRRRRTGASRLRRRGERLRPPLTPSVPGGGPARALPAGPGPAAKPLVSMATPWGGVTAGGARPARTHAGSRGLAGLRGSLPDPSPCGLPPGGGPRRSSPGSTGKEWVLAWLRPLGKRSFHPRSPRWRTYAAARGCLGWFLSKVEILLLEASAHSF